MTIHDLTFVITLGESYPIRTAQAGIGWTAGTRWNLPWLMAALGSPAVGPFRRCASLEHHRFDLMFSESEGRMILQKSFADFVVGFLLVRGVA